MTGISNMRQSARPHGSVDNQFARDVIDGLSRRVKCLPCRYLYDARGSELFDLITSLPEYYATRAETEILAANAAQLTASIARGDCFVEFGSGSSIKTELLLRELPSGVTYIPIDVSHTALAAAASRIRARFPDISIKPVVADFSDTASWSATLANCRPTLFFPGSTIGNLHPVEAGQLMSNWRKAVPQGGRLIVGVDLRKSLDRLLSAYNDAQGVTADFNMNLLVRINRDLGANFDIERFRHEATYDARHGRIEMHLVSTAPQTAIVCGRAFQFGAGESIHTENSYKYTIGGFQEIARTAGWKAQAVWTDGSEDFSVHEFSTTE